MIQTIITKLSTDWTDVKNKCRTTVNKGDSDVPATDAFKRNILISEHSPIRLLRVSWCWQRIKYWLSTEFSRHHIGWEKWISTQRDDRTSIDRNSSPQDTPVAMAVEANAQSLINVARFRLCHCAHKEAREYMENLKRELHKVEPEIAYVMQKNCVYRCGCPEFKTCGWWDGFIKRHLGLNMCDINARYRAAEFEFYFEVTIGSKVEIVEAQVNARLPVGYIGEVTDIHDGYLEGYGECIVYLIDNQGYYPLEKLRKVTNV